MDGGTSELLVVPRKPGNRPKGPGEGKGEPEHGTEGGKDAGNPESLKRLYETSTDSRSGEGKAGDVLAKRFAKYGLALHPEKTRLVPFRRPAIRNDPPRGAAPASFDLLGFTHHRGRSLRGNWVLERKTASSRFGRALHRVAEWCRRNRHQNIQLQQQRLTQMLRGHYGYFGIIGNADALRRFFYEVRCCWRRWLDRRTGRHTMQWPRFARLLERYPLPSPVVVHRLHPRAANP
jgi:hypothetical protein